VKLTVTALFGAVLALPVLAQDAPGASVLQFDFPGAPKAFAPVPGRAGLTRFGALDALSIEGQAGSARLVVEFALPPDAGPDAAPIDARVTFRPDGFTNFWQTAEMSGSQAIRLTQVALSGPQPRIAGSFAVTLCARASVLRPADPDTCQIARGEFSTQLQID